MLQNCLVNLGAWFQYRLILIPLLLSRDQWKWVPACCYVFEELQMKERKTRRKLLFYSEKLFCFSDKQFDLKQFCATYLKITNIYCMGWYWYMLLLFSCPVMSNCLLPHGLQHARPPCPSLSLKSLPKLMVHCICHAIQPSHPLTPSSSALSHSQHQGLFQWIGCSHLVTNILELQHQSFHWVFRTDFL